jgi:hypothetical protein
MLPASGAHDACMSGRQARRLLRKLRGAGAFACALPTSGACAALALPLDGGRRPRARLLRNAGRAERERRQRRKERARERALSVIRSVIQEAKDARASRAGGEQASCVARARASARRRQTRHTSLALHIAHTRAHTRDIRRRSTEIDACANAQTRERAPFPSSIHQRIRSHVPWRTRARARVRVMRLARASHTPPSSRPSFSRRPPHHVFANASRARDDTSLFSSH